MDRPEAETGGEWEMWEERRRRKAGSSFSFFTPLLFLKRLYLLKENLR